MAKTKSSSHPTLEPAETKSEFTTVLNDVGKRLDKAYFDRTLKARARDLAKLVERRKRDDDPEYWDARNVLAEVYDHFGERTKAAAVTETAEPLRHELEELVKRGLAGEDTLLRRAQVRHVLFRGQVEYRNQQFEKAEVTIKFCERFVKKLLEHEEQPEGRIQYPHWKTRGLIQYFLGRVYRHQNKLDEAVDAFEESIRCYYERAHAGYKFPPQYSYYRLAKALALGVGWVKIALGQYREALRQNLMPAAILFESTRDNLNKERVRLLVTTAEIALAGDDRTKLEEAVGRLQKAKRVFRGHPRYTAKAARECCLAHSRLRQFTEADQDLDDFKAEQSGESGECQYLILKSLVELDRAELGDGGLEAANDAQSAAAEALQKARLVLDRIEALIACGRARFLLGEFTLAKKDFRTALDLSQDGFSITTASCFVHLARTCAKLGEASEANSYLQQWKDVKNQVEHETLRKFAEEVSREVADVGGFVIGPKDTFVDFKSRVHQLRGFLEKKARSEGDAKQSNQAVARKLGMSALGLQGWEKRAKQEVEILKALRRLCNRLRPQGERAVKDFERLLDEHGAYVLCRKILRSEEAAIYDKIFQLAFDDGTDALELTVERLVAKSPEKGLFSLGEKNWAEKLFKRKRDKARNGEPPKDEL